MIYELPTRSPIKYRGKYPLRARSVSYSTRSPEAIYTRDFLSLNATPVHVELNDGRRFIVSGDEFSGFARGMIGYGEQLSADTMSRVTPLHPDLYAALLVGLNEIRDQRKAAMSGVVAA